MRPIDADALKEYLGGIRAQYNLFDDDERPRYEAISSALLILNDYIEDAPTIDPVVHGEWNFIGNNMFECTSCGVAYTTQQLNGLRNYNTDPYAPKYCPNCGAKNGWR